MNKKFRIGNWSITVNEEFVKWYIGEVKLLLLVAIAVLISWRALEYVFVGKPVPNTVDTIIGFALIYSIYKNISQKREIDKLKESNVHNK